MKPSILIIEDERSISAFLNSILTSHDYYVACAANGADAMKLIDRECPDLILLDLGLPDMDGSRILKSVRKTSEVPVIIISARGKEAEKVKALDMGADDYLSKPFGTDELLARIRTALRHSQNSRDGAKPLTLYQHKELKLDFDKRTLILRGESVHLTQNEYNIVKLLAQNGGKVLTHDYIIGKIWGFHDGTDNKILRVNMANIRRKLEKNPAEPEYIFTEVGVGYRMPEAN